MATANAKAILLETLTRSGRGAPKYSTSGSGPSHEQTFTAEVAVDGEVIGVGTGKSKRVAERVAAEDALERLGAAESAPETEPAEWADGRSFDGPWPVLEHVLAGSLAVAQARVPAHLYGDEAREAVAAFALTLYKDLLLNLGEIEEVED